MRITLTLSLILLFRVANAQIPNLVSCGQIIPLNRPYPASIGHDRNVIWSETFANGIPNTWINTESNTIAQWQYRGANTNPTFEVGTQGSCLPEGVLGDPIQSPTQGNGFVIFDSNWWDNSNMPCTEDNMGSGAAPGPHYATLTTPNIDLSNQYSIALEFYQYFKAYESYTSVEISLDNGASWYEIYSNIQLANPTDPNSFVQIPIGNLVGGWNQVQFRFVFSGQYYFWQLDDIAICTIPEFDISIENTTYGDFDLADPAHPTGFEFMEYTRYPLEMSPLLKFSATAVNNGVFENPDVRLNVDITDENNASIHNAQSDEGFYVFPNSPQEVRAGSFQMPSTLGNYQIHSFLSGNNGEAIIENDHDTAHIEIHSYQMARDHRAAKSIYYPNPAYHNTPYEIGNVFLNSADNMQLYSLSAGLGVGTILPTNVYGVLYEIELGKTLEATLIATTPAIDVTNEMLNNYGEENMTLLHFDTPISLQNGKAYLAMIGSENGGNITVCALSGPSPAYTSFVQFLPGQWNTISQMPMVRMNFDPIESVTESSTDLVQLLLSPNPSTTYVQFNTEQSFANQTYVLYNLLGERILEGKSTFPRTSLDVSTLAPGAYQLICGNRQDRFIKK